MMSLSNLGCYITLFKLFFDQIGFLLFYIYWWLNTFMSYIKIFQYMFSNLVLFAGHRNLFFQIYLALRNSFYLSYSFQENEMLQLLSKRLPRFVPSAIFSLKKKTSFIINLSNFIWQKIRKDNSASC